MITVSCRFAHSFKIMRITQPIIPFRSPPQPVQFLCSGRGGKIDVLYIRSIDGQVPKTYELWPLAEDGVLSKSPKFITLGHPTVKTADIQNIDFATSTRAKNLNGLQRGTEMDYRLGYTHDFETMGETTAYRNHIKNS